MEIVFWTIWFLGAGLFQKQKAPRSLYVRADSSDKILNCYMNYIRMIKVICKDRGHFMSFFADFVRV